MNVGAYLKGSVDRGQWTELRQMKHFGRVLRLVWPHRRYLLIAMVATVGVAICYTASLASLYPILKVLVEKETIHDFVDRVYVANRLDLELTVPETEGLSLPSELGVRAVQIVKLKKSSELYNEQVSEYDFISDVDDKHLRGWEVLRYIALQPDGAELALQIYSPTRDAPPVARVRVARASWHVRALRRLVQFIPREQAEMSQAQRMRYRLTMLGYVLGMLVIISVIGNICRFVGQYYGAVVGARTLVDLRRLMYSRALMQPMDYYLSRGVSDMMSRFVRDTHDVMRALRSVFTKVLREPMKAMGAFAVPLYYEPRLTLLLVVLVPITAILFRKFGRRIRRANEKLLASYGRLLGALESTLRGVRVVKAYTMEHQERKRYFRVERDILKHQLRIDKVNAMASPILEVLGVVVGCVGILWIISIMMQKQMNWDSSKMFLLVAAMAAIAEPLRKLANVYSELQKANAAAKRIYELVDLPTEFDLCHGTRLAEAPRDGIVFENVSFSYPGADHPAVSNVDLTIKAGSVVAVVGPNGSGKTTLISLLMRLFDPQEGSILWDGVDLRDFQLRPLRRRLSYVSQDTVMFAESIRDNIAYGNPRASMDQIVHAARQAHADEFIDRLSEGYETVLGEQGATLSGGERQRLAIARAILRDAPVLIFDEATSQIDAESEAKIQDAIDHFMPGRTAIVIAHRFSTISKANLIVVMDYGKIVAVGTHQELMEVSPLYQTLYQTQLRGLEKR